MAAKAGKIFAWTGIGLLTFLILSLSLLLSPPILGPLVKHYAPAFLDGEVQFSRISGSLIRHFPALSLRARDFAITYAHDTPTDTLVSSREIDLSLSLVDLLRSRLVMADVQGEKTRVFIHYFADGSSNLDIFGSDEPEEEDGSSWGFAIRKAGLHETLVRYRDAGEDALDLTVQARDLALSGWLNFDPIQESAVHLSGEELLLQVLLPGQRVDLHAEELRLEEHDGVHQLELKSFLSYSSPESGQWDLPIALCGEVALPAEEAGFALDIAALHGQLASVDFDGRARLCFEEEQVDVDADLSIDKTPLQALSEGLAAHFPALKDCRTDATLSLHALARGAYIYDSASLPALEVRAEIPPAHISYPSWAKSGRLALNAALLAEQGGPIHMDVDTAFVRMDGLQFQADGSGDDILGEDPHFRLDGSLKTRLDSLLRFVPAEYGLSGRGQIDARIKADASLSQLDAVHYPEANIDAALQIRDLAVKDRVDSLEVNIPWAELKIAAAANRYDPLLSRKDRVLAALLDIDSLSLVYCEDMFVRGRKLSLAAQSGAPTQSQRFTPVMGYLSADQLSLRDIDSLTVAIRGSKDSFRMEPDPSDPKVPKFSLSSQNDRIFLRQDVNRVGLRNVALTASAKLRREAEDSLRRPRRRIGNGPSWLRDSTFRSRDLDLRLDESLAKYIREWDASGEIRVSRGMIATPYFPLKNRISSLDAAFTTDQITLNSLSINSGDSDISASGSLKGLRRALTGKGILDLTLDLSSDRIDADELIAAYQVGSQYAPASSLIAQAASDTISDNEYQQLILVDTLSQVNTDLGLIVIPANLRANLTLQGNELKYQDLDIDWLSADVVMKQRCIQITNGIATSNMGDLYFEGYYATHSRDDISGGIDINMIDITAEDVIRLVPAIGEMEPMLTNFKGKLDCELAAVSQIDTTMSFVLPSVNGVMTFTGKDLSIEESPEFRELAKSLFFRDKKKGKVKKMSVSGLVKDNALELFPFVVKIDRYSVALSGVQSFDESFKYHVSVLRSPLLLRFGVNLYGDDFDSWKFKLTKARYRSSHVPVFTQEVNTAVSELQGTIHRVFETGTAEAGRYDAARWLSSQQGTEEAKADEELSTEEAERLKQMTEAEYATEEQLAALDDDADLAASIAEESLIELNEDGEPIEETPGEKKHKRCFLRRIFSKNKER